MRERFEAAHRARYGYSAAGRELIIQELSVEAIGRTGTVEDVKRDLVAEPPNPIDRVRMYGGGGWADVPLHRREDLQPGQEMDGPAIIVEATGTTVVEQGWKASMNGYGHLVLVRVAPLPRLAGTTGTEVDPIMLEVFNNLFMSIAEQMGVTLAKTAYSVNIRERLDFSCALFDPTGGLVANAPHVPVHLGSMSVSVRTIIRQNQGNMRPGDVFMLNAPFNGGTHLPDVTVVTPVFDEAGTEILFYVCSRGHHADIGGRTPGSAPPDSRHIDEEGVLIDNFKLIDQGRLREVELRELLASGPYPCRDIETNLADLAAQVAANESGAREVRKMVSQFGLDVVQAYMRHVQDNAEASVRNVIGALRDGSFTYRLDEGAEIKVAIQVDREAREAAIDFTGTSSQQEGNYNAPLSVCYAVVLYVFRTLVNADIPLNEGSFKPLRIIAREGTMINPSYPAAVIAGNTEVSQAIANALYGALSVLAGSQGTMNNFVWGNDKLQNYETICGGTGAGPTFDGADAVHSHMTNTRMTDPEVLEWRFPVRVEEFAIRRGSGGAGKHRGGDGVVRRLRFLEKMTVTVLSSHRKVQPFGLAGGSPGAVGQNVLMRADGTSVELAGNDGCEIEPGDVFIMKTPGGGGFGLAPAGRNKQVSVDAVQPAQQELTPCRPG